MDASYLLHSPAATQWKQVSISPHHGIAIPLFSLHSEYSCGIGEFTDLIPLIDWCKSAQLDVIQLLPLNDIGLDHSPYASISAFAINPLHLGLHALPYLEDFPDLLEELKAIPKFSNTNHVDYIRVRENKERFLKHYHQLVGPKILESAAYRTFLEETQEWLTGYAAYKVLKKRYHYAGWENWPEVYLDPNPQMIAELEAQETEEFHFYRLLQFLCDQQMKQAKAYATKQHVLLMGDIPILINRDSADVWLHRSFFDLHYSAGAPPDLYSLEGQEWGFPIYNWSKLAQENYQWWRQRLQWASRYYHLYRIDHIVGFFRIWAIPLGLKGKDGHFIPKEELTWIDHGQRLMLMMLEATSMLPIGEDLGTIPLEVRACMRALGICGTRVMRWERKWHEGGQFIPIEDYAMDSITTVSTHDSESVFQWWRLHPEEAQLFAQFKGWMYQPILSRDYLREILWDSHHTQSLFHVNPLQEYLTLIPGLTWPNPEEERINIPGIYSERNWCYRLKPSLEELEQNETLKHIIRELVK